MQWAHVRAALCGVLLRTERKRAGKKRAREKRTGHSPGTAAIVRRVSYMYDTVWIQSDTYCISCISPPSRYSEIQYIPYLLYLGPDTVDTVCISPWFRYGGYVSYMYRVAVAPSEVATL